MTESTFQECVRRALNAPGRCTRVHRQNSGKLRIQEPGGSARWFTGYPKGAADLSGLVKPEGWRLEIECKVGAPWTEEQRNWASYIELMGGIYVVVRAFGVDTLAEATRLAVLAVDEAIAARRRR